MSTATIARVLFAAGLLAPFIADSALAQSPLVKHTVNADGQSLALWEKRAAKPRGTIVLLHGRTWSSLPDFDLQVPGEHRSLMDALVARGYAVYALDLRGYGGTPRDASGWDTPDRSAEDLSAALDWVAKNSGVKGKPALLGWSNGSTVAELCAQRHPDQISALILTGYWKHPDSTRMSGPDTLTPARAKTTAADAASDFIAPNAISKKAVDAYVAAALKADPVRTDWRRLEQFNAIDPAKLTTPTLLIQGELDPIAPTATQAAFFSRIGTGDREWIVMAGGDHASLIENMQPAFVSAVVNFLDRPVWRH
ncbi:MAG TPA: alpha/beta fold hydrolase [Candidatus Elarobacter sp.]|nr:alpha/beta fold hydrolase [Candidatus Elarobacter sp.]